MHFVRTAFRSALIRDGLVLGYLESHFGGETSWRVNLCSASHEGFFLIEVPTLEEAERILLAAVTDYDDELRPEQVIEAADSRPVSGMTWLGLADLLDVLAGVNPGTFTEANAILFLRLLTDRGVGLARRDGAHG